MLSIYRISILGRIFFFFFNFLSSSFNSHGSPFLISFSPSTMFLSSTVMTLAPPKYRCVSWDSFPPLYNSPPLKTTSSKTTQECNAYIFMDYTSTLKTFRAPSISQITLIFDINREFKLRLFFNNVIKHFKKSHYKYIYQIYLSFTMPYMCYFIYGNTFGNNWLTYTTYQLLLKLNTCHNYT